MPLDPRGDSCERRASLDDFVDKKCLGVIRRGLQSETVETHEDGHGRGRHALVAVDEGVVVESVHGAVPAVDLDSASSAIERGHSPLTDPAGELEEAVVARTAIERVLRAVGGREAAVTNCRQCGLEVLEITPTSPGTLLA
jgi:hypothetical protein